jgi:hypothetical protein
MINKYMKSVILIPKVYMKVQLNWRGVFIQAKKMLLREINEKHRWLNSRD